MASLELDLMEYSTDALAQAAYVTDATYDSYTKTASHFDGTNEATAYTDPIAGAYTFVGTAQLSTAQNKFGTASLLLDGNSDYVTLPDSASWAFGTGNFTIDFWIRGGADDTVFDIMQKDDATNYWFVQVGIGPSNNVIQCSFVVGGVSKGYYYCFPTINKNTWYHVAFVRNGTTGYLFLNGVNQNATESTAFSTNNTGDFASVLYVGTNAAVSTYFNGWIDELRISKGIARWTSDFTPPTYAYPYTLQSYSESTIKTQGDYSLKGVAAITDSLNKTLTKTATIGDLTSVRNISFDMYASRTGANIKIGLVDAQATTEITPTIITVDTWQKVNWDLSAVADANKNAITAIVITIVNADAANTFYIDNFNIAQAIDVFGMVT